MYLPSFVSFNFFMVECGKIKKKCMTECGQSFGLYCLSGVTVKRNTLADNVTITEQ